MHVLLNGEHMLSVCDTATFHAAGPFVLDTARGLKMFAQGEMYNTRVSLRLVRVAPLEPPPISLPALLDDVRRTHGEFHTWRCSYFGCNALNGSTRPQCHVCGYARRKSADEPKANPDASGVQVVVGSTLKLLMASDGF